MLCIVYAYSLVRRAIVGSRSRPQLNVIKAHYTRLQWQPLEHIC